VGGGALLHSTVGDGNTATGFQALLGNTTGSTNTAVGNFALVKNTTGNNNTAIGASALAGSTGSDNIAIGFQAGSKIGSSGNIIAIGSPGDNVDGGCYIGNIRDVSTSGDAIAVVIDSSGKLGTTVSSRKFKKRIKPMDSTSEAILALKPVTFHYRNDKTNTPQFGLIAEDVANVNPDLVVRDKNGEIYTVRYDAVNAMLLNEFLKAHRRMKEQQNQIDTLTVQLKVQAAQIQRVSAQVEVTRPSSQRVANTR